MSQRLLDTRPNEDLLLTHGQELPASIALPDWWS
jgi:hypothetical protein